MHLNQLLESAPSKAISNLNSTWFPTNEEPCKQFRSVWHHFPVFSSLQKVTELTVSQTNTVSSYILQSSSLEDLTSFIRSHMKSLAVRETTKSPPWNQHMY